MRLVELEIARLPGVHAPFSLTQVSPHVTVVVGPNASGKSSLVRALRALWNSELHAKDPVDVRAEFRQALPGGAEAVWRAMRVGPSVVWERDGVPAEAPAAPAEHLLNSYLVSIETLVRSGNTDSSIGEQLRRDMSGGYDLSAAQGACKAPLSGHRLAARKLVTLRRELAQRERAQAQLHVKRLERDKLAAQQVRAAAMAADGPRFTRALDLSSDLAELDAARAELAGMPSVLGSLTGHEAEDLAEARSAMTAAEGRRRNAELALAEAQAALLSTGLAETELDEADAHSLQAAAEDLRALAEKATENDRRHAELSAALREPWRRLGGGAKGASKLAFEPGTLNDVEDALGERMAARALVDAARAELVTLDAGPGVEADSEPELGEDAALSPDELGAAQFSLSGWLAAPAAAPPAMPARRAPWGPMALLFAALVLLLVAGAVALGASGPGDPLQRATAEGARLWAPALGGLLAGLAGLVWLAAGSRGAAPPYPPQPTPGPEAEAARTRYLRTGAREPREWKHEEVASRLRELLALGARREAEAEQRRALRQKRAAAESRLFAAEARLEEATDRLRTLARSTGYHPPAPDVEGAGFAAWLRDVRQVNDLTDRLRGLGATRSRLEEQADRLYSRIVGGLAGTPFEVAGGVAQPARWHEGAWRDSKLQHAEALVVLTRRLVRAVTERDRAKADSDEAQARLDEAEAALGRAQAKRGRLLARCGVDGEAEGAEAHVAALMAELPTFHELTGRVSQLDALVAKAELDLAGVPHVLDAARRGDVAALERGAREAEEATELQRELSERIGEIDGLVKEAERGRELERARAKVEAGRREVADHLRLAQLNCAADVLFEDLEQEFQVKRRPRMLELAGNWFARFTHGAFELDFEPGEGADQRLRAREAASGSYLLPAQLSTGTRAQLLLAFRVAHAACAEDSGVKLPFFLDEALTTADALRFAQVAATLLELSRDDGRQLIYLSARQEDAVAWRTVADEVGAGDLVRVIDLAETRRVADVART